MKRFFVLLSPMLLASAALAQPPGMIVNVGQVWRQPYLNLELSPGQITTLYVHGVGGNLKEHTVFSRPFPYKVEGISVTVADSKGREHPAPILAVEGLSACYLSRSGLYADVPCGVVAGITVQIPYELNFGGSDIVLPFIRVYLQGQAVAALPYSLLPRTFYIVTGHDGVSILYPELDLASTLPIVRRPDGTLVHRGNPAKPGETLTMLAVGLGYDITKPDEDRPKTGEPAPEGVNIPIGGQFGAPIGVEFQFGKNREVNMPAGKQLSTDGLLRAYLLPGLIGMYEITVQVPKVIPPGTPNCGAHNQPPEAPVAVDYNLRVVIGYLSARPWYFPAHDSAAICVAVP
ncbi:MAG: hypothetical protein JNK48_25680 [Bryobacterales bacterium]|nr:hypothetical protein [Bryobacterales bacterium]